MMTMMTVRRWLRNCGTKITHTCSDKVTSQYMNACVQVLCVHVLYISRTFNFSKKSICNLVNKADSHAQTFPNNPCLSLASSWMLLLAWPH